MALYRAHSAKSVNTASGFFDNPYLAQKRVPRDTPQYLHDLIGSWFEQQFGLDYRSRALFCTGDRDIAVGYTSASSILIELTPVPPFRICFSPRVKDLFGYFQFAALRGELTRDAVYAELEKLGYVEYRDASLDLAAGTANEVMAYATRYAFKQVY